MHIVDFHIGVNGVAKSALRGVMHNLKGVAVGNQWFMSESNYKEELQPLIDGGNHEAAAAALKGLAASRDVFISRPKFIDREVPVNLKFREYDVMRKLGFLSFIGDKILLVIHLFIEDHYSHIMRYAARGFDFSKFLDVRPSWMPLVSMIRSLCGESVTLCVWNMERKSGSESAFVRFSVGKPMVDYAPGSGVSRSERDGIRRKAAWPLDVLDDAYEDDLRNIRRLGVLMEVRT